LTDRFVAVVLR